MEDRKKHILVVEDDDLMRDELSHTFAQNGYAVSTAKTGEEAVVIALQKNPDLITLDIMLPRMGGLDMLRQVRADDKGKDIPVLILSNLGKDKLVAEAMELGGCDYLVKADWGLQDVLTKVNQKFGEEA